MCNHQQGLSLLEMLLVVVIIAMVFVGILGRLAVWNSTYNQAKKITQVQETVAELLAAASARYYQTCHSGQVTGTFSCQDLGLDSSRCLNPWWGGPVQPFSVQIARDSNSELYQLKVIGDFYNYRGNKIQLAQLLNADAYDASGFFYWTRLPSNNITNQGVWYRVPGNYLAVTNTNEIGGNHFDSNMWIMKAGLAQFAASQQKQGGTGACPD
jgi:prepilin-type N-terminal cleavage/methylation domain-containing protein